MVVDTSALFAIVFNEAESEDFSQIIARCPILHVSAATLIEATAVALGRGEDFNDALEALLSDIPLTIVPVDAVQVEIAKAALKRYGKGRHKARLNLGDSFAYALAMHLDEALLFKGEDFPHTDVKRVF